MAESAGQGRAPVRPPRALVLVLVAVGIVLAAVSGVLVSFRLGGLVLAAVLAGTALARLLLGLEAVGPLAVRSRRVDAATSGILAVGVAVLALTAPDGS